MKYYHCLIIGLLLFLIIGGVMVYRYIHNLKPETIIQEKIVPKIITKTIEKVIELKKDNIPIIRYLPSSIDTLKPPVKYWLYGGFDFKVYPKLSYKPDLNAGVMYLINEKHRLYLSLGVRVPMDSTKQNTSVRLGLTKQF